MLLMRMHTSRSILAPSHYKFPRLNGNLNRKHHKYLQPITSQLVFIIKIVSLSRLAARTVRPKWLAARFAVQWVLVLLIARLSEYFSFLTNALRNRTIFSKKSVEEYATVTWSRSQIQYIDIKNQKCVVQKCGVSGIESPTQPTDLNRRGQTFVQ